jgi:ankyrin repeat protein
MLRTRLFRSACVALAGAVCLSVLVEAQSGSSLVADAAQRADRDGVKRLLGEAADVNAAQGDGMTALHWAAMNGDVDLARMLLFAGANIKATTRLGNYTPLYLAARQGRATLVPVLIQAGADPKEGSRTGTTALMVAAESGSVETVAALLDAGADPNAVESVRGLNALMFAASADRAPVITLLASRGADLKSATKVIDLTGLTRDRMGFGGNPSVPGAPAQGGAPAGQAPAQAGPGGGQARGAAPQQPPRIAGVDRQFQLNELIAGQGGFTPLLFAARDGLAGATTALLDAGADVNQVSSADGNSPLMAAVINGHFDLARTLIDRGADVTLAAENGATPLYAALNVQWAPKALYPQPQAHRQQTLTYLDMMQLLLDKGASVDARLNKKVWYSGYSFDLSGVDEIGATPFWRAAYASDIDAMKLLVKYGADPNIRTIKPAARARFGDGSEQRQVNDTSTIPPVPIGGPSVTPLQAAAGVGYGEGFAANSHRYAPGGMLAAVQYLVDELSADVNAADHEGNTALHHAAARGDNEMIKFLVSRGANVKAVDREGRTTVDMANGPVQRTQPYPETIKLLESLGAINNHKCISC